MSTAESIRIGSGVEVARSLRQVL